MLFSDYDDDVKTDKCIRPPDTRVVYICVHLCTYSCYRSSFVFLDSDVHCHSTRNHLKESTKYRDLDEGLV